MAKNTSDFLTSVASLVDQDDRDPREVVADLMQVALDTGIRKELRASVACALEQANGTAAKELTDLACRRLKPGRRLSDPQYAGLTLVATTRGKRWIYRTQKGKRQRQITLGHYPAMSLAEAREAWAQPVTKVADKRSETTLDELTEAYITAMQTRGTKSWRRSHNILTKNVLPNHGGMRLGALDVEALNATFTHLIDDKPGAAHNIRMAMASMFKWAGEKKMMPAGVPVPQLDKTPKSQIKDYRPSMSELRTMVRGLDALQDIDRDIMRLQLLTGTRISEALGAEWSEIDLEHGRWTIPAQRMKAKKEHLVMLSAQAVELLRNQPTREGRVFGRRGRKTVSLNWARRRDELSLPTDYTSHANRKALLSWVAENGGGKDIRDRLSAHSPDTSEADAHYQLSELNQPAAEWWQKWADFLDSLTAENVVQLSEGRV